MMKIKKLYLKIAVLVATSFVPIFPVESLTIKATWNDKLAQLSYKQLQIVHNFLNVMKIFAGLDMVCRSHTITLVQKALYVACNTHTYQNVDQSVKLLENGNDYLSSLQKLLIMRHNAFTIHQELQKYVETLNDAQINELLAIIQEHGQELLIDIAQQNNVEELKNETEERYRQQIQDITHLIQDLKQFNPTHEESLTNVELVDFLHTAHHKQLQSFNKTMLVLLQSTFTIKEGLQSALNLYQTYLDHIRVYMKENQVPEEYFQSLFSTKEAVRSSESEKIEVV